MLILGENLVIAAVSRTGPSDFGDAPLAEGLEQLCASLNAEANLTASGEAAVADELIDILVQRLRLQDWFAPSRD